jgi:hypothetical protein
VFWRELQSRTQKASGQHCPYMHLNSLPISTPHTPGPTPAYQGPWYSESGSPWFSEFPLLFLPLFLLSILTLCLHKMTGVFCLAFLGNGTISPTCIVCHLTPRSAIPWRKWNTRKLVFIFVSWSHCHIKW